MATQESIDRYLVATDHHERIKTDGKKLLDVILKPLREMVEEDGSVTWEEMEEKLLNKVFKKSQDIYVDELSKLFSDKQLNILSDLYEQNPWMMESLTQLQLVCNDRIQKESQGLFEDFVKECGL